MTAATSNSARPILLGRIAGAHGIRGEVLVHTYTGEPAAIASYGPLDEQGGARRFKLKVVRVTPKGVIARVEGVADRNAAESLKGVALTVPRDRLPPPAEGEFYHEDLVGLAAYDAGGMLLGEVTTVQNFGAGDLIELRLAAGGSELIPFTLACVPEVDIAGGRVVIRRPDTVEAREGEDGSE
jgi:16S rRNA processing protein RimM